MNISAVDLASSAGVSLRQLGHWIDRGYVRAALAHPGSGHERWFTAAEARRVRILAVLVHAGLLPHAAAAVLDEGVVHDEGFSSHLVFRDAVLRIEVEL